LDREKRAKDQALDDFKDKVERNIIFKGETVSVLTTNLSDVTGNYSVEKIIAAPGGQLLQIYYILEEILKKYPKGHLNYM
jgi:hypothetical protein